MIYTSLPYPKSIDDTHHTSDTCFSYYDDDEHDETESCLENPALKKLLSVIEESTALVKKACSTLMEQKQTKAKISIDRVIEKCCSPKREEQILKRQTSDIPELMRVCKSNSSYPLSDSMTTQESFL